MARGGRGGSVAGRVLAGVALGLALVTAAGAETVSTLEIDGVISPITVRLVSTATVAALSGQSGSVTVAHDGPFGAIAGKAVALEPATGFAFDSPMETRR